MQCKLCLALIAFVVLLDSAQCKMGSSVLNYTISEESNEGFEIGDLFTDAKLRDIYTPDKTDNLKFRIISGAHKKYFSVDSEKGILTTNSRIDRDEICPANVNCELQVDVITFPTVQHFIKITIVLLDLNDNVPTFPENTLVYEVSEGAIVTTSFVIPSATDMDSPNYGIQRYRFLSNDDGVFEMRVTENTDGTKDLHLILQQKLDRELKPLYYMSIIAIDGGSPALSGTMDIEIKVIDVNDNRPEFRNSSYEVFISEDTPTKTPIVSVTAVDLDDKQNGLVIYDFAAQTIASYGNIFGIRNSTGEIYLRKQLDHEEERIYHLVVTARDQGSISLTNHVKVTVHVKDVNDHRPRITVSAASSTGDMDVSEAAKNGTFVAHISVEDPDQGVNGEVSCELHDKNFILNRLFPSGNEFKLLTATMFDRELKQLYRITIECHDMGIPPQYTNEIVNVRILDENDNAPEFPQTEYSTSIRENNTSNLPLLRLTALDADIGDNAEVEFKLHDDANNLVKVDRQSGVLSTNAVFDHEKMARFIFHVIAIDKGTPSLSATATITLNIVDINDEAPIFPQSSYSFGSFENQPIGTEIGTLTAEDRDTSPYDAFTFSLDSSRSDVDSFQIEPNSGKITTKRILDREHQAAHSLVVIATDIAFPRLSSSTSVTVYVADRNDNAPSITFPDSENNTVHVSSLAPPGYIITRVEANDADLGDNAKLGFTIAKGNHENLFDIDSTTGELAVAGDLTADRIDDVDLLIQVQDLGEFRKSAVCSLHVVVNRTMYFAEAGGIQESTSVPTAVLGYHQTIILVLGTVTAVLVVILLTAIFCIKKRQRRHAKEAYKYVHRVDMVHRMGGSATDQGQVTDGSASDNNSLDTSLESASGLKKEVKFSLVNRNEDERRSFCIIPGDNNTTSNHSRRVHWNKNTGPTSLPRSNNDLVPQQLAVPMPTILKHGTSNPVSTHPLPEKEIEVHLLDYYKKDHDNVSSSGSSLAGSNTDSGRGCSEEGDNTHSQENITPTSNIRPTQLPQSQYGYPDKYTQLTCADCGTDNNSGKLNNLTNPDRGHSNSPPAVPIRCAQRSSFSDSHKRVRYPGNHNIYHSDRYKNRNADFRKDYVVKFSTPNYANQYNNNLKNTNSLCKNTPPMPYGTPNYVGPYNVPDNRPVPLPRLSQGQTDIQVTIPEDNEDNCSDAASSTSGSFILNNDNQSLKAVDV